MEITGFLPMLLRNTEVASPTSYGHLKGQPSFQDVTVLCIVLLTCTFSKRQTGSTGGTGEPSLIHTKPRQMALCHPVTGCWGPKLSTLGLHSADLHCQADSTMRAAGFCSLLL